MIKAYNEIYLEDAMDNLGAAFDYAINTLKISEDDFVKYLINSSVGKCFEKGHPSYISGMSGIDLVHHVLDNYGINKSVHKDAVISYSIDYWIGSSLAYYEWYTSVPFKSIFNKINYKYFKKMYRTYHEMDIARFVEEVNRLLMNISGETNLAKYRKLNGYSQSELAKKAGVSLRMIQLYEQRVNSLDKASAHVVYKLSTALGINMIDLLEMPTLIEK